MDVLTDNWLHDSLSSLSDSRSGNKHEAVAQSRTRQRIRLIIRRDRDYLSCKNKEVHMKPSGVRMRKRWERRGQEKTLNIIISIFQETLTQ